VAGASEYFVDALVTYSNAAKHELLGVPESLIAAHGAVSRPVAEAMAAGCRRRSGSDLAVAITGIAGPTGGTDDKPVGLVHFAVADANRCRWQERRFGQDMPREAIRYRAALNALNMLRLHLMEATP